MANKITIEIPEQSVDRAIEAFCAVLGYQEKVKPEGNNPEKDGQLILIPNPTTKEQFLIDSIKGFVKSIVAEYDRRKIKEIEI